MDKREIYPQKILNKWINFDWYIRMFKREDRERVDFIGNIGIKAEWSKVIERNKYSKCLFISFINVK